LSLRASSPKTSLGTASRPKQRRSIATNFSARAEQIDLAAAFVVADYFDNHRDCRPGRCKQNDAEHRHLLRAFARGFDQIFAAEIMPARTLVVFRPKAVPLAIVGLKKAIGPRKAAIFKLRTRLHNCLYSLDRSTPQ